MFSSKSLTSIHGSTDIHLCYFYIDFTTIRFLGELNQTERNLFENKPAVAGQDHIQGSNQDDGRYDEPNPEDLEQMEKLLEDAVELQGI